MPEKVVKKGRPRSAERSLEAIASSLERLVELKELELRAIHGLTVETGREEGEILYTDEDRIAKREEEEEIRQQRGLPASANLSPVDESGRPWGWGIGPEGADSPSN